MRQVIVTFKGTSPYSQGKFNNSPDLPNESKAEKEVRTWREKLHYDQNGQVFIPPMQFAISLKEAAKYMSIQIPGKGKSTYTKNFEAGVMVTEPVFLNIHKDDVQSEALYVPSDGKKGGTTRVTKYFPIIHNWTGSVRYLVLDDVITEDVFRKVVETSGLLIGVGRFRPRNGGYYGRFEVVDFKWLE